MKAKLLRSFLPIALIFTLVSCTSDNAEDLSSSDNQLVQEYDYNETELQLARLINDYRESKGLQKLEVINHISYKSEEHNEYMIANNVVNHDYFQQRSQNIIHVLGAVKVNENVAYNYITPEAALHAWLNSPGHKANIEGDFSSFGISVKVNPENGKKYYTNIFMKK
ncbi:MAG TPA: CAP domain-containing protein [Flavobacterium sp.]|jgi:uncharacterized protein YkwD